MDYIKDLFSIPDDPHRSWDDRVKEEASEIQEIWLADSKEMSKDDSYLLCLEIGDLFNVVMRSNNDRNLGKACKMVNGILKDIGISTRYNLKELVIMGAAKQRIYNIAKDLREVKND